jgi:hypothetical protein
MMFTQQFDFFSRIFVCFAILFSLSDHMPALPAPAKQSITLTVDTLTDQNDPAYQACSEQPDDCSLRGAISNANAGIGNYYVIQIPAGVYLLTIIGDEEANAAGDLDIHNNLTLAGAGALQSSINGNQIDRVLHIHPGVRVSVENLTITGGKGQNGIIESTHANGGGVYNSGELTISQCNIEENKAGDGENGLSEGDAVGRPGGNGGGIFNDYHLELVNSFVNNNQAGVGGKGYGCVGYDCQGGDGGPGGGGGGIYNLGDLTIDNTQIAGNYSGGGGNGYVCVDPYNCGGGAGGPGGVGGGIYNLGDLTIDNTQLTGNNSGGGGNGRDCVNMYCGGGAGGPGGGGGGIYNLGTLIIDNTRLTGNNSGAGGNGGTAMRGWGSSPGGPGGGGGGIYNRGVLTFNNAWVTGNSSGAGGIGGYDGGGYDGESEDGGGGSGGGIYNDNQVMMISSSINNNSAYQVGGGIYNSGHLILTNSSVMMNTTLPGSDGRDAVLDEPSPGNPGPPGGGIYNEGTLKVNHSEIIGNITGQGGNGGDAGWDYQDGADGGEGGQGGGVFNLGNATFTYATIRGNSTGNGGHGGLAGAGGVDGQDAVGGSGGGIHNQGTMTINLTTIQDNTTGAGISGGSGGGIFNSGSLTFTNSYLQNNETSPSGSGGGISNHGTIPMFDNCIVSDNYVGAGGLGSGLYLAGFSVPLIHTTIVNNTGGDGSGIHVISTTLSMTNTILVGQTVGISLTAGTTATLESTLWGSGVWANQQDWSGSGTIITGTHNYWDDPAFVNPSAGDYHLEISSPAIDKGVNTFISTDVDNQPRPNPDSGVPDLGADEFWNPIPITGVNISGPITGTVSAPITFTASITPANATPNFLYLWTPEPEAGQLTQVASFVWLTPGVQTITVSALNAANVVTDTFVISIEAITYPVYLPLIARSP